MMRPIPSDDFLDDQLQQLEHLVSCLHPEHPEVRRARWLLRRARSYRSRGLIRDAPRTRRYLLADVHNATQRLRHYAGTGKD